ncbi:hypothetical protein WME73_00885 [Sorangium sp. So ce302]|uniref:hypothetical protein n=1 Tax=Sorangium sp. So ce302 TaxID=3133297 RepID=UPI003F633488
MPRSRPNTKKSSPAKPGAPSEAAKAFALVEPEIDDVREVVPINVDIPRAVAVAIGAVPHLQALRPRFVEELPKHPLSQLDKLQTYALAAWYAHLLALPTSSGPDALKRCRRAASYLRWNEGDADAIAPSLFAARGGGRKPGAGKNNAGDGGGSAGTEPGAPGGEPLLEPTVEA